LCKPAFPMHIGSEASATPDRPNACKSRNMMHTGDGAQKPPDVPQMEVMQVRSQGQSASEPQVLSAVTY